MRRRLLLDRPSRTREVTICTILRHDEYCKAFMRLLTSEFSPLHVGSRAVGTGRHELRTTRCQQLRKASGATTAGDYHSPANSVFPATPATCERPCDGYPTRYCNCPANDPCCHVASSFSLVSDHQSEKVGPSLLLSNKRKTHQIGGQRSI